MQISMETYLRQGQRQLRRWALDPRVQSGARLAAWWGSGFFLSAGALCGAAQPLAMGLICAASGWRAAVTALGAVVGYRLFWGSGAWQCITWALAGLMLALFPGARADREEMPLLIPALSALGVSAIGLMFQLLWQDTTPPGIYMLRIASAACSTGLFRQVLLRRDSITDWMAAGVGVLALAPVTPIPFLGLGYLAAGAIASSGAFPAAALAGLALDLARITPVPMAATVCIGYFFRLLPTEVKWLRRAGPGLASLCVMAVCGVWDPAPVPGLLIGGLLGHLLPPRPELAHRRGETGVAQVRLEVTAGVLAYTQQLLLEAAPPPIDEEALLQKVRSRACAACSARSTCPDQERLTVHLLHYPLDFQCRKTGRVLGELRRAQEQLKSLKADRHRLQEYRGALLQQYRFLSEYLRSLSDQLPRRGERVRAYYRIEVSARSARKERANGDRCTAFPGTGCRYYILLCDGMGTGLGAAEESRTATELVRQMLTAGFPAEHAFRSVNSILALRGQAGAVTLDLAEVRLDTGRVCLYKWGAAPSWVLRRNGAEKIGTATPPPGISVLEIRETVVRLSLRRGEALILLSDGVEAGELLRRGGLAPELAPGELAQRLLDAGGSSTEDDATAAVIRLYPTASKAS